MKLRFGLFMLASAVAACAGDAEINNGGTGGSNVDPSNHLPQIVSFGCDPSTAAVPMSPNCSWQVQDADGDTMSCGVDIGADGTTEFTFPSCPATGAQLLTINQVGDYQIMFTVTDSKGGQSFSTVQVTGTQAMVMPPNNHPPAITSFTAAPMTGISPLNVQFNFSVSDPDNDATTCRLLEGSTVLVQPSACATNEQRTATFMTGTHNVTLEVSDTHSATATQSVTITASDAPPTSDVSISKIEWGQSIVTTTPRLVADKDALLRVYVLGNHAGVTGTVVTVSGTRGSTTFGPLTLTGPATAPTAEAPADLTQQWRVVVPGNWLETGLSLTVNAGGKTQTITPAIGVGNVLPITMVPVTQGGHTGTPLDIKQGMTQFWPLKDINVITRAAYTTTHTLSATTNWDVVLQELDSVHTSDGSARDYLGWVKISYQSGIFGIGYVGEGTALSADSDVLTSVHELGHNMNRNHAPCGGASSPDPAYPVSTAHLDGYGWDYVTGKLQVPTVAYDVMAYCDPQWISAFNYNAVQTWLEQHPVSSSSAATASPRIIISGNFSHGELLALQPVTAISGPERLNTEGDYSVTVHGNGKTVTVPFKLKPVEDVTADLSQFSVLVPDLGAVDDLEISHGGKVIAKRLATAKHSGADPKVRVVHAEGGVQLLWNDAEWPYASIAHLADSGRTTLSLWREGGEAFVSTQGLNDGGAFEVSLSDGIATKRVVVAR